MTTSSGIRRVRPAAMRASVIAGLPAWSSLGLCGGDLYNEFGVAWVVNEQLRTVHVQELLGAARWQLARFYGFTRDADTPELVRFAKTISRWKDQIMPFFTTGRINALFRVQN